MAKPAPTFHVLHRSGFVGEFIPKTGEKTMHTMNKKPMTNVPTDEALLPGDFPRVFADADLKALQDGADAAEILLPAMYNCSPRGPRPKAATGGDEMMLPMGVE